ncbi:MT-A70 family [Aspergillus sp. HF37]|nr:MT-A70 family [Aspergillus sp. HF37]
MTPSSNSPVLYQNASQTVFLIDIPASIARGQRLSPVQHPPPLPPGHSDPTTAPSTGNKSTAESKLSRCLLSSPPLETPYPPSTEPKTDSARSKVLQTIPPSERAFHGDIISPLVRSALAEIQDAYRDKWCLPRRYVCDAVSQSLDRVQHPKPGDMTVTAGVRDPEPIAYYYGFESAPDQPPVVLSPSCVNGFRTIDELTDLPVLNTSSESATVRVGQDSRPTLQLEFTVPPLASFVACSLPTSQGEQTRVSPAPATIPGLGDRRFNLILLDPPWPNRSVRRGRQYRTNAYFDVDGLTSRIADILRAHLYISSDTAADDDAAADVVHRRPGIAAIWVTNAEKSRKAAYNALQSAGLGLCAVEEWVWVKTTTEGEPVSPVDALWRKPYEMLVIGRKQHADRADPDGAGGANANTIIRRVIAAVPDVHSRKPNLRDVFERVFFSSPSPAVLDGDTHDGVAYSAWRSSRAI